ncbi:hypothetical protein BGZ52_004650 [Haplosporangium bisporale]|nr:hypothetical protein BGZ52_004650 [Haplosporangium bisporale]KAF9211704.1 hypothetical protein BGZ59_007717 [Podila verticillata]KAI9241877.1 MAG: hypothetical protein BYD32DRAFT_5181 [Podila humilis]KFH67931.1 hypothetical protein MVEG_06662 [Podila verticillata NRRL 6337]
MAVRVPIRQDRSLFNAKFEGYKLSFLEESRQHFVSVGQSGQGVTVPKLSSTTKLSYREVQHRVRHNHLHPGWNTLKEANGDSSASGNAHRDGVLFAIDEDYMLIALQYDKSAKRLRSKTLLQIPVPVTTLNFHLEFPLVKPLSADYLLVSDGATSFYLVRLTLTGIEFEACIVATTDFKPDTSLHSLQAPQEESFVPCGLLDAKAFTVKDSENEDHLEIKFLVHYTLKETFYSSEPSPHRKSDKKTLFIVSLCSILWKNTQESSSMDMDEALLPLDIVHSIRGTELPFYCALDPSNEGYVLGSNTSYKPTQDPVPNQTTRYMEPGSSAMEVDGTSIDAAGPSEPPYIWTQTDSDVTICFALPKGTTKHAVQCKFSRQGLQLQVNLNQTASETPVRTPQLDNMPLFDLIQPDDSFWTLEASTGVLTLSIEKQHSKTRWTQVFAEGVDTDPVEETLDPSVFAEYKASLEKYTTDQANAGPQGSSLLPAIAQDAQEDIDEEGEEIKFSWVQSTSGSDIIRATTIGTGHDWIGQSFSTFEPQGDSPYRIPTVCLKHDVDGLVYSIQHTPGAVPGPVSSVQQANEGVMKFVHTGTFDALAFVQASKREKRWVMHDPYGRFSAIVEASRNVYIYWHTHGEKLKQERQTVIDVSKGQAVDIIGCQLIADGVLVVLMDGRHGALVLELNQS